VKTLSYIFFSLIIILVIILTFSDTNTNDLSASTIEVNDPNCPEKFESKLAKNVISRNWEDYNSNQYCIAYTSFNSTYHASKRNRITYTSYYQEYYGYWGKLYKNLYENDRGGITTLVDSLSQIQKSKALSHDEFANVIVGFVQDIPYSYVLQERDCSDSEFSDTPCIEGEKFGILSPIEFLHTLSGDCDTRTVLLYTILRHFKYSPKIVVSLAYEHSMLLLDVATSGEHFTDNGKKFYFWETTGLGWQAGIIPPGMSELKNWHIVLN
jgi:hypothetical protein